MAKATQKDVPVDRALAVGKTLSVVATPQDAEAQPARGDLSFVDNVVDPSTDPIKLKATFGNIDHHLWPGQFARVSLRLTTLSNATVVPQQAVQIGQDGQFVFVVTDNSTAEQRPVTVGRRVDDEVVIEKGLKPGETVVTEGQLRLEQGTRVASADANPASGGQGGLSTTSSRPCDPSSNRLRAWRSSCRTRRRFASAGR
jgi:multidrug efflux system membrane fusion protein